MAEAVKWEEFFRDHRYSYTVGIRAGGLHGDASVEDLYQAFKARLIAELMVDAPDLRAHGVLVSK